jgi:hypothetical protein
MKTKNFFPFALVGLSVILTACGQVPPGYFDQNNNSVQRPTNLPRVQITNTSVQGNWYSECWSNPSQSGTWFRETLVLFGAGLTSYSVAYEDANCSSELYRTTESSSYSLNGDLLTETYAQMSVTPSKSAVAAAFNGGEGFCKKKNWSVGSAQSFNDVTVCGLPKTSAVVLENYGNQQLFATSGNITVRYIKQ